jgi:hypothetical protein
VGHSKRTRAELIQLLADQREALAASCEGYDNGKEWEAARLATTVFTLVHDGGAIRSLLTQLGLRASLRFVSTGRWQPPPGMFSSVAFASPALVTFHADAKGMRLVPQFQHSTDKPQPTKVQFEPWWSKEDIYDSGGMRLTRRRLVFSLRHQDGGGHVGELTDPAYVRLKAGAGLSGNASDGSQRELIEAANATMRQVAWEVTETLKDLGEVT